MTNTVRVGGAAGYSVRALGYIAGTPTANVYHTLQLWRDEDLRLLFTCNLSIGWWLIEGSIQNTLAHLTKGDLDFLVELARTAFDRRAIDSHSAAQVLQ